MKMYELGYGRDRCKMTYPHPFKKGCGLRGPSSLFLINASKLHVESDQLEEDEAKP